MKLVFLGPPGAGKGTQAMAAAKRLGIEHASTGEIFRAAVKEENELGKTVKEYLDSGRLVPDDLTSRVVKEMVLERRKGYILDGYPRTVPQAEALRKMLQEKGQQLDLVLHFELDEHSAVQRLTGRLVCGECGANYHKLFMEPQKEGICDKCGSALAARSDSTHEVVRGRLHEYYNKTQPLVPYYEGQGILRIINASGSPEQVAASMWSVLDDLDSPLEE